jgi:hypothetical protein
MVRQPASDFDQVNNCPEAECLPMEPSSRKKTGPLARARRIRRAALKTARIEPLAWHRIELLRLQARQLGEVESALAKRALLVEMGFRVTRGTATANKNNRLAILFLKQLFAKRPAH